MDIQTTVEKRWKHSAIGYSSLIKEELDSSLPQMWKNLILSNAPKNSKLRILDVGTGPGFFSIIFAQAGHDVTAIDCTGQMIVQACKNAEENGVYPKFKLMDSHHLDFDDNSFDLIINRNVTWTLNDPKQAYKEWHRVLSPGGKLIIFDANWHMECYDDEVRKAVESDKKKYRAKYGEPVNTYDGEKEEGLILDYYKFLPLSNIWRPRWDKEALEEVGYSSIKIDLNVNDKVYSESKKILYASTPMFMIIADK